jgi:DNA-binding NtrC family response regulator
MSGKEETGGRVLVLFMDRAARARWKGRLEAVASAGYSVREAEGIRQAEAQGEAGAHDVALVAVSRTAGADRKLIELVARLSEAAAVVLIGGEPGVASRDVLMAGATEALPDMAADADLIRALSRAVKVGRELAHVARFDPDRSLQRHLGASPPIRKAIGLIDLAAGSSAPVLVTGEPGTGKAIVARAIHAHEAGRRRGGPFIRCLLRAIDPGDLEETLYGTDRCPGLYELAHGGTLYLKDVPALPAMDQARLEETLEARVGARIIVGSTVALDAAVSEGRLRPELLMALNVLPIDLPPLRERPADIPALATAMIDRRAARLGKSIAGLSRGALELLQQHTWPGNIRELERCVEAAVGCARGSLIEPEDLAELQAVPGASRQGAGPGTTGALEITVCLDDSLPLAEVTRRATAAAEVVAIRSALARAGGNISHAARDLRVSRSHLQKRIKMYGLRAR